MVQGWRSCLAYPWLPAVIPLGSCQNNGEIARMAKVDYSARPDLRKHLQQSDRREHFLKEMICCAFLPKLLLFIETLGVGLGTECPDGGHARDAAMRFLSS